MQMKIETLTWEQVNAVWRSDEFCMLTNSQLAALHKRFEQLKLCRAFTAQQREWKRERELRELQLEKKRLQDALWVARGVRLRCKRLRALKRLPFLAFCVLLAGIAVYMFSHTVIALGMVLALLGYFAAIGLGTILVFGACAYAIGGLMWGLKRLAGN